MSITRKFATTVAGTITGLAGLTLALVLTAGSDEPTRAPEQGTSEIADAPGSDMITSDFPWN